MTTVIQDRIKGYVTDGLPQVVGWFESESAEVVSALLVKQLDDGVGGNVAEIGVHHGKSFLLLANGVRDGESAVALDVFGDQQKNVDRSGLGDRDRFEQNVQQWAPSSDVKVVQTSSLEVEPGGAVETFGRVRLMSIDGGHTAEITEHDLRLAESCVDDLGVVMLDDLLNSHWLGVLSGTSAYLSSQHRLVPFAYSPNKLYLAPSFEVAEHYRKHLRRALPDLLGKRDVEFFERTVDVYGQGSPRRHQNAARARVEAAERTRDGSVSVETLRRQLSALRAETSILAHELASSQRRVRQMTESTSWRVSAPLRLLGGWRRGRRGGHGSA